MKKMTFLMMVVLLVGGMALTSGQDARSKSVPTTATPTKLTDAGVDSLLIAATAQAIAQFSSQLQTSLKIALDDGGPLNAINVCNVVAPDIQIAHVRDGWFIERVSAKPRNHNNQADSAQLAILASFEDGAMTPHHVIQWNDPKKREKFRFYSPIRMQEACLSCHGDVAGFVPGLSDQIKQLYPRDKAVGYKVGDLRGMFAIEVLWPEGRAYAEKLAGGAKRESK